MNSAETEFILGYPVCTGGVNWCVDSIFSSVSRGQDCQWLACINPHSYAVARRDKQFSAALKSADWLTPDGGGIVLASRILGGRIRERVTGSDIFKGLNERLNEVGGSVFFLGATEEMLELIRGKMLLDYPSIRIAGTYSPPFKHVFSEQDTDAMVKAINAVAPDVLWVGLTSPKQDMWIYANRQRLKVKFAAGVGAVFDFYTGRVKRSHPAFQKIGLEWLPRLLQEPRRLWRRMFVSAPVFLWDLFWERVQRGAK